MRKLNILSTLALVGMLARGADYLADGPDNGRTGWVKDEKVFNTTNAKDMKLLWQIKLDSAPRSMHNLFPPIVLSSVATSSGRKEIAITPGVSDDLFAIDTTTGRQIWRKHFDANFDTSQTTTGALCPGGQTAEPVAENKGNGQYTVYALAWDGRLRQLNAADGKDLAPPIKFLPPNGKPFSLNLYKNVIYTSTAQRCGGNADNFFALDLETRRTSVFSPAGGGLWGRRGVSISSDGTVYMGTGDGVFDPEAGRLGQAIVGVTLNPDNSFSLRHVFSPKNADWLYKRDLDINVSPVAIDYKGKHFVIGTSKECRMWLLDGDHLGGADYTTPLDSSQLICNDDANYQSAGVWGAPAAWVDAAGAQWLAVPFWGAVSRTFHAPVEYSRPKTGGVAAFKLEQAQGKWKLVPQWLSRDIYNAEEAVVAGGVLFTYASGEDTRQSGTERRWDETGPVKSGGGTAGRIAHSTHIVAYALDAATGKELWSSGDQVKSFSHFSGLTAVNGKLYIPSFDGTLYCFGVEK